MNRNEAHVTTDRAVGLALLRHILTNAGIKAAALKCPFCERHDHLIVQVFPDEAELRIVCAPCGVEVGAYVLGDRR